MSPANFARDYVEVADRIRAWYERYPDGRIHTFLVSMTDSLVVMRAEAWRGPAAPHPNDAGPAGIGHSALAIPGETPFTRGAELENAETSAVGRALVMAGIPSKNVASANEVRAKKSGGAAAPPSSTASERGGQLKSTNKQAISGRTTTPSPGSDVEGSSGTGAVTQSGNPGSDVEGSSGTGAVTQSGNTAAPSANVEAPGGASTTSGPSESESFGEGGTGSEGTGHFDKEATEQEAVRLCGGNTAKVIAHVRKKHPDWLTDPEYPVHRFEDLAGWHFLAIVEDFAEAAVDA